MSKLSNPHDRFFKETLTRQEVGRDFLIHYLPGELVALLDVDSLEISKDSFVDQELREHFSDVLYKVDSLRPVQPTFTFCLNIRVFRSP